MKKKIPNYILIGAGLVIFAGVAIFVFKDKIKSAIDKVIVKKVKPNSKFLFIGDSNTKANFSYADKLRKEYEEAEVHKLAENGKKTEWMYNELKKLHDSGQTYDVISILGGSNDISAGVWLYKTKSNLNNIFNLAKKMAKIVVVVSPPSKDFYTKFTDKQREELNELVKWLSENKQVDYFIDFKKITSRKDYFSESDDYLHPQSIAHDELYKVFKEKVIS